MKSTVLFEKVQARELNVCVWINRACSNRIVREFFSVISWLGDGRIWYALMVLFPLAFGVPGLWAFFDMAIVGLAALVAYKLIKKKTRRVRPYMQSRSIQLGASPLDQYSFPSGHTLHAVSFTLVAVAHFPSFAIVLVPLTALIAISRVVLGLHFPTDVVLGAAIGAVLAEIVLLI